MPSPPNSSSATGGQRTSDEEARQRIENWLQGVLPDEPRRGSFNFRTVFPSAVSQSVVRQRPAYYPMSLAIAGSTDILAKDFPNLQPRPAWKTDDGTFFGLSFSSYVMGLYNLEGCLLNRDMLCWDSVVAGLALALQDLRELVWFPTEVGWCPTIKSHISPRSNKSARGKRFLVIPIFDELRGKPAGHWSVAIVDRNIDTAYYYNTSPSLCIDNLQDGLQEWLHQMGLMDHDHDYRRLHLYTVPVTEQAGDWECGIMVVECVRCFFREPFVTDFYMPTDWTSSLQYLTRHSRHGLLDTTQRKLAWMRDVWTGWIRLELGHADLSGLRIPSWPLINSSGMHLGGLPRGYPIPPNILGTRLGLSEEETSLILNNEIGVDPCNSSLAMGNNVRFHIFYITGQFIRWTINCTAQPVLRQIDSFTNSQSEGTPSQPPPPPPPPQDSSHFDSRQETNEVEQPGEFMSTAAIGDPASAVNRRRVQMQSLPPGRPSRIPPGPETSVSFSHSEVMVVRQHRPLNSQRSQAP